MPRTFLLYVLTLFSAAVLAQNESTHTFIKIIHTPDGTTAIDAQGKVWSYDSEKGDFVIAESQEIPPVPDAPRDSLDQMMLPPEVRCTDVRYGDINDFFNDVTVGLDERIEGSVTSGKDVTVKGLVTGDIVSFQTVVVENSGEVRGNITAREIRKERGGKILGQRKEVAFPRISNIQLPSYSSWKTVAVAVFLTGFLIFICVIVSALVPVHLGRVIDKIDSHLIKSFFWGILGWFAIAPIFVLLLITIVGIPIAILLYPLVILAALGLGFTSMSIFLGSRICPLIGIQSQSIYIKGIIGVLALKSLLFLMVIVNFLGSDGLFIFFMVLYIIVASVCLTIGFGAVLSARFGLKPRRISVTATITVPSPPPSPMAGVPPMPSPPPPIAPFQDHPHDDGGVAG
jgi:hypothetical protein